MSIRNQRRLLLLGLVAIGLVVGSWLLSASREQLLLEHSRRIMAANSVDTWVSVSKIASLVLPDDFTASPSVVLRNIIMDQKFTFPIRQCSIGNHLSMSLSPDGQWLLYWWSTSGLDHATVTALNLATGKTVSWPSIGDARHYDNLWIPNSRYWIQLTTLPDDYVTIYSLDVPAKPTRIALPHLFLKRKLTMSDTFFATQQKSLVVYALMNHNGSGKPPLSNVNVEEYSLLPHLALRNRMCFSFSEHSNITHVVFSATADQVAFFVQETFVPPMSVYMHRLLPNFQVVAQSKIGLWVCSAHGTPREIGYIAIRPEEDKPTNLQWIPHSNCLSFVYKQQIYSIPAQ